MVDSCKDVSKLRETGNPFINQTDVLILLYRYWVTQNPEMSNYVKDALKAPVVTFEVRAYKKIPRLYLPNSKAENRKLKLFHQTCNNSAWVYSIEKYRRLTRTRIMLVDKYFIRIQYYFNSKLFPLYFRWYFWTATN